LSAGFRSGIKPVEGMTILKGRIIASHIKDLNEFGKPNAHDVPYGTGVCDIKGCLTELRAQHFRGDIAIEYEYDWENNVPEVAKCVEIVRNYRQ